MGKKRKPASKAAKQEREHDDRVQSKKRRREAARAERERELRRRRRQTKVRRAGIASVAVVAVVALAFVLIRSSSGGVSFEGNLQQGGRLEALSLPALEEDGEISYASYSDRPLVLNFFASWCPNCIAEMPRFEQMHQAIGDQVSFLGVSQGDPARASIDIAHETGISYDTAIDQQGELFRAFGGLGMPVTVFLQPGGEISEIFTGELSAEDLSGKIQQHFDVAA